ncbi:NADPH:quinone reductase [Desulfosediminicola sp.]|uniref:NADPH:quinone reductase n=1 Tax=Desulfosediminicola sp. TaxID=2886825 RepID=UPI003AF2A79E
MRIIEVRQFGGPDVLTLVDRDIPVPGKGQVVIKVEAIGVNPVDTYIRAGTYPVLPELPYIPGGNAAGTVQSCGEGVTELSQGQRVYTACTFGAYGEYCLCDATQAYDLPEEASFAQGATLGVPGATAWRGLFIRGLGKAGEKVLVHGASGSVGGAALQLGRAAGMEMYGTAGSEQGLKIIDELGAVKSMLHQGDYVDRLRAAVPGGFDLILEMLANVNLETDLSLLAPHGRVVIIGSRGRIEIDPRLTMGKETDIRGLALAAASSVELKQTHAALAAAVRAGVLRPLIAATLPLEDAPRAHQKVLEPGLNGKIILSPGL